MGLSKLEKETVINFNEEEPQALIYSCSRSIWKRCEKLGLNPVNVIRNTKGRVISKEYECPRGWVKIRKPRRVSQTQREKSAETMRMLHRDGKI